MLFNCPFCLEEYICNFKMNYSIKSKIIIIFNLHYSKLFKLDKSHL